MQLFHQKKWGEPSDKKQFKQVVNTYRMHADGDCFESEYAGHYKIDHLKAYENERDIPIGPDVIVPQLHQTSTQSAMT